MGEARLHEGIGGGDHHQPFDYTIDVAGVVITGAVIIGYFIFMLVLSEKEYKQVIAEKFD